MWIIIFFLLGFYLFIFFFEKFLLVCFNLLYVVMFLFLGKVIFSHVEITMLLLKRSGHLFGIFVISSRGFSFPTIFFFLFLRKSHFLLYNLLLNHRFDRFDNRYEYFETFNGIISKQFNN